MPKTKLSIISFITVFAATLISSQVALVQQAHAVRDIVFPVLGDSWFMNDYYASRGDRLHYATDIIADKGQPLVAAAKGTIIDVQYPKPRWGYSVTIRDDDGWEYVYIHMNDDTPGTDDDQGGPMNAYAADMRVGNRVARGQLLGWVGDSGYANNIPHLHFEMYTPSGKTANPYWSLREATRISKPRIPGKVTNETLPYGNTHKSNANVAMGNFDGDPESEFVTAPGIGGGPHIKIYDSDGTLINAFMAYNSRFRGGVDVAAGDINGDGTDEIITGPLTGGPHIRVFDVDGTTVTGFFAFDSTLRTGVKVAAGDTTGDHNDEVVVGLGPGSLPQVKVFDVPDGTPALLRSFNAYDLSFRGGVDVAVGNMFDAYDHDEIVTSPGPSNTTLVRVFASDTTPLDSFRAFGVSSGSGVRVSVGNVDTETSTEEILVIPSSNGKPQLKMVDGNGVLLDSAFFIEQWWVGGYDVAAGNGVSKAITGGNRRVSVRAGLSD